ncbi:MAG: hypothetical protein E8D46_17045 [Nitrospira sp.]|nr:hypothetical protein [Nitrospira sp.]TKB71827.1 MAG: hypothetical protein E8D46_17045 [Nitrospira sp.]
MTFGSQKYFPLGLGLLSIMGAAFLFFIMFKAGCAGDSKGGSLGNPVRALQLESYGLLPLLLSAASGGAAIGFMSKSVHRVAHGLGVALLMLFCLWLAAMQFEMRGIQSCF